jgi:hypothetical protein
MRNFVTLLVSLLLVVVTAGTAWILISLSGGVEFQRLDPGNTAEVTVP